VATGEPEAKSLIRIEGQSTKSDYIVRVEKSRSADLVGSDKKKVGQNCPVMNLSFGRMPT